MSKTVQRPPKFRNKIIHLTAGIPSAAVALLQPLPLSSILTAAVFEVLSSETASAQSAGGSTIGGGTTTGTTTTGTTTTGTTTTGTTTTGTTTTGTTTTGTTTTGTTTTGTTTTGTTTTGTTTTGTTFAGDPSRGSQIITGTASATVHVTRTFTEALSDRNEETVTGDGTLQLPALPANVLGYAEPSAFQAKFPISVKSAPVPAPAYRVFATGFGGAFDITGGQSGSFYGGLAGLDYQVLPNLIIGGAVGGSTSRVNISSVNASGNTAGVSGSIYAIATAGAFYAQTLTTFSSFSNHTTRNVDGGGAFAAAIENASFGSFEIRERAEFGRVLTEKDMPWLGSVKVTPFIALEIANLHLNGHSEINVNGVGNFAGLTTPGQDIADVPGFVGARFEKSFDVGNGMVLTPILRAAYVHQFASQSAAQTVLVSTGASVFTSNGTLLGRDAAQVKAGAELSVARNTVIFANFEGLFSGNSNLYGGRGGVRVAW